MGTVGDRNRRRVLVRGDVDAIKDFVFETSSLPQIRGGSQLLVECEEEISKRIKQLGGEEIYCSGGSFLFSVPIDKAEEAKTDIEKLYLDRTLVATVTVVYEQNPPPQPLSDSPSDGWARRLWDAYQQAQQRSDFARRVSFLSARLREAKVQKRYVSFFEALPFGHRCEGCGKRVALEKVPRYDPEEEEVLPEEVSLCQVCLQRHRTGVSGQHKSRGKFNEEFQNRALPRAKQPPDLDHLVKSARRKYVAFLYADGNDIGQLLQQVQNEREFKVLSKALTEGVQQALFDALHQVCSQELQEKEGYWPFEIVNIGGDDVTLLIQAGYAWEVAVVFLQKFEEEIKHRIEIALGHWPQGWPEKITASCGIAIADVKHPVRYLENLASDLLKQAKQEAKAKGRSALSFLWLTNPIAIEKAEPLMAYYTREQEGWLLTARPYGLEQAKEMISLVQEASCLPRHLRYRWAEALEKGRWVSISTIYYDIARRKEEERAKFADFLSKIGKLAQEEPQQDTTAPLWQSYKNKQRWRTAMLDVLELAELHTMRSKGKEKALTN